MKAKYIQLGSLVLVLLLSSSCSHLPLYSKSRLDRAVIKERHRAIQIGRADELRRQAHRRQRQKEQAKPEPEKKWFSVPVEAHVNEEGVRIDAHSRVTQIIQP